MHISTVKNRKRSHQPNQIFLIESSVINVYMQTIVDVCVSVCVCVYVCVSMQFTPPSIKIDKLTLASCSM